VLARLNRGNKTGKGHALPPEYFVFPAPLVAAAPRSENWGKVMLRDIPDATSYIGRWDLIRNFLLHARHGVDRRPPT
jgi:hypothetical protein